MLVTVGLPHDEQAQEHSTIENPDSSAGSIDQFFYVPYQYQ